MGLPATYENIKPYLHLLDWEQLNVPCGTELHAYVKGCKSCPFSNRVHLSDTAYCSLSIYHEGYPAFLAEIQTYYPELLI